MSDYNLTEKSSVRSKQLDFLSKEIVDENELNTSESIMFNEYAKDILRTYTDDTQPLFKPIPFISGQIPWIEDVLKNYREISEDIKILNEEQNNLGQSLTDNFNFVETEKKRLLNRLDNLGNLTGDLNLISNETSSNVVYIKESFQNTDSMDIDFMVDSVQKVSMLTREGIITLGETGSIDLSRNARVAEVSGNGTPGGDQLVRKVIVPTYQGEEVEAFRYLSSFSKDYHSNPDVIIDGRPDTVFEYQMVNVPESFKSARRYYDFEWAKGKKHEDLLRLKLTFDLGEVGPLNWISIIPFFAYRSNGRMIIHSLKTSEDGFEYQPLYQDKDLLQQELSDAQSKQELKDLFTGNTSPSDAAYSGKGVWLFPEKKARYVEIVLDQDQSYTEIIGQSVYSVSRTDDVENRVYIPAPEELKEAEIGDYIRSGSSGQVVYRKSMDITPDGWRYAIGLRDIHFMRYTYSRKSLFVSKPYKIDGEIDKVMLYANEVIPNEYQDIVEKMNDWIIYEISFDDLNWYRISPMHHEPVNANFPPKIIEVNGDLLNSDMSFELHKQYIQTEEASNQVRLRITLLRPETVDYQHTTPIVNDIALKIQKKEAGVG